MPSSHSSTVTALAIGIGLRDGFGGSIFATAFILASVVMYNATSVRLQDAQVPRESLLFVIPAFGGVLSWEGERAPFKETDQTITHQIVDRPTQGHKFLSREYVQPQRIFDCVNSHIILPTKEYIVGSYRVPPPHLSLFVDNEAEGYVPEYAETIKQLQAAARKEVLPMPEMGTEELADPQNLLAEGIIDRAEAIEAAEKKKKVSKLEKQYHDELKLEFKGSTDATSVSNENKTNGSGG